MSGGQPQPPGNQALGRSAAWGRQQSPAGGPPPSPPGAERLTAAGGGIRPGARAAGATRGSPPPHAGLGASARGSDEHCPGGRRGRRRRRPLGCTFGGWPATLGVPRTA
eukprot:4400970-Alexandrium_andersonii.AAC.1